MLKARNVDHEIGSRIVSSISTKVLDLYIYDYDFGALSEAEKLVESLDADRVLKALFREATAGLDRTDHRGRWLAVQDFVSRVIRHPPLRQPMRPDKSMVTHPLVLLHLGEGRCGHTARLIVDIALANGYEARLVQLATHLVAEVKYDGKWRWVDADADFPIDALRALPEIPSVEDLARNPYWLDSLPARGWQWSVRDRRTVDNGLLPIVTYYPGEMTTSSYYFGREIFENRFAGDPEDPRPGVQYYYKLDGPAEWRSDIYYGWHRMRMEQAVTPMVPVEFHPQKPRLIADQVVLSKGGSVTLRVRFAPVSQPVLVGDEVRLRRIDAYELRVSNLSRGWDYDFRNYRFMAERGSGDLAVIRDFERHGDLLGADLMLPIADGDEIYFELVPRLPASDRLGSAYLWPSNEARTNVIPGSVARFEQRH